MKDAKYPTKFACSITAASSLIGPVIPPSIPIVLYAIVAGVSVNQLLIAGIIPGILMALALSIFVAYQAIKYNYPTEAKASMRRIASTGKRAILPLMTPVILVGGILSGVFTATEGCGCWIFICNYPCMYYLQVYFPVPSVRYMQTDHAGQRCYYDNFSCI